MHLDKATMLRALDDAAADIVEYHLLLEEAYAYLMSIGPEPGRDWMVRCQRLGVPQGSACRSSAEEVAA